MECKTILRYDEDLNPVFKNKRKFDTLDDAIKFAKIINTRDHQIRKVVAYKCKECHKYHIGRNGKEIKQKERDKWRIHNK